MDSKKQLVVHLYTLLQGPEEPLRKAMEIAFSEGKLNSYIVETIFLPTASALSKSPELIASLKSKANSMKIIENIANDFLT